MLNINLSRVGTSISQHVTQCGRPVMKLSICTFCGHSVLKHNSIFFEYFLCNWLTIVVVVSHFTSRLDLLSYIHEHIFQTVRINLVSAYERNS
jgi:hypothetical protein